MCVYCMVGDEFFGGPKPPFWWPPGEIPVGIPMPAVPIPPDYSGWDLPQLRELLDILERVKHLEDSLTCPCTPAKADYISIVRKRIEELESQFGWCEACLRRYKKPVASYHTRVQCLEIQLADAKVQGGLQVSGTSGGSPDSDGPPGGGGSIPIHGFGKP